MGIIINEIKRKFYNRFKDLEMGKQDLDLVFNALEKYKNLVDEKMQSLADLGNQKKHSEKMLDILRKISSSDKVLKNDK